MKSIEQASLVELILEITGSFEHESVMASRCVRISFRNRLVDQQRQPKTISGRDGDIESRVFVGSHRMMQPVEDELAVRRHITLIDVPGPLREVLGQTCDELVVDSFHGFISKSR